MAIWEKNGLMYHLMGSLMALLQAGWMKKAHPHLHYTRQINQSQLRERNRQASTKEWIQERKTSKNKGH